MLATVPGAVTVKPRITLTPIGTIERETFLSVPATSAEHAALTFASDGRATSPAPASTTARRSQGRATGADPSRNPTESLSSAAFALPRFPSGWLSNVFERQLGVRKRFARIARLDALEELEDA